ncbi:MAG: hypothetical protein H5T99_09380, partial [Moorella sp. (in: Bacteria)]|nr:hypothetical protein [Moorella sp. (in: firmicutes)]
MSWPFRKAAQGAWWLAKSPFVLYKKGVVASWENAETYKGKAATAFGAAAVGAVLVGTYAGAGLYVGTYGVVAAGDYYWFGQSYSEGDRVGTIAKLSNKGKFPCNTVEGELAMPNLGAGGSSTFSFSVR